MLHKYILVLLILIKHVLPILLLLTIILF